MSINIKYMKIKVFILSLGLLFCLSSMAQTDDSRHEILLRTTMGDIRIALYNETPLHRDNMLRLVRSHQYDGLLFHRVIKNFMIQGGDQTSREAEPGVLLGDSSIGPDIPAEIRLPQIYHKRGVLAQAREGDDVNPERKSSGSQFYIVWGKTRDDAYLDTVEENLRKKTGKDFHYTPEMREVYRTQGGTPHLDGLYTVYGEVVEGLDVVDRIQNVATNKDDRPLEDVRILVATVVK